MFPIAANAGQSPGDAWSSLGRWVTGILVGVLIGGKGIAAAAEDPNATSTAVVLPPASTAKVDFSRDIRPLFERRCVECHGADKRKGGLRLDRKADALRGGTSHAPAIVPGKSAESPLVRFVAGLEPESPMPPEGERLTAAEVGVLRAWIDQGATWPDAPGSARTTEEESRHWAYQPVHRAAVPSVKDGGWVRNAIDAFVLARLEKAGLTASPVADRRTLARRLWFDVVGLPPTAAEVTTFEAADAESGYPGVVDRLLSSPRHGERWAQHWLDVVRYSETHGFEMNNPRPSAWPYRDYVIRAFNEDLPYDRFVREQLAGDALGSDVATGFLVAGPWDQVKSPDVVLTSNQRADELHDIVNTTGSAFLGLTVGCARCHEHKFDPIPQREYYALKAVFEGVQHGERPLATVENAERQARAAAAREALVRVDRELSETALAMAGTGSNRPPVGPRINLDTFTPVRARALRMTIRATGGGEPCVDELEVYSSGVSPRNVALASAGARGSASGTYSGSELHRLEHLNDGRYGNSRSWISNEPGKGWVAVTFPEPVEIDRVVWARDREGRFADRLATEYVIEVLAADTGNGPGAGPEEWRPVASSKDRGMGRPAEKSEALAAGLARRDKLVADLAGATGQATAYVGQFRQPEPTRRFQRGDPMQPREVVAPGALAEVAPGLTFPALTPETPERERRLALAAWITDPAHPLTARVIVNRLWQHHFGEGLVSTPSDFGVNGARPTHPELLDWLAAELVEHGWSLRHVHRLILNSATYRQASTGRPEALRVDAGTRWWWRYPPRRMEAEAIRDAVLAVSGSLDVSMGGPGWSPFEPNENYVRVYTPRQVYGPETWRRMVYATHVRQRPDGVFGVFDCPDGGQIAPRRTRSTTPLQALNLMNSGFLLQQAGRLAERLERETEGTAGTAGRVRRAFELVFQREPEAEELVASARWVEVHGWTPFCRALLNANEFVYVF